MTMVTKTEIAAKVLFVDDEANILSSIRRAVIDEDYTSFFASSGPEALEILDKQAISVIVTDMRMPGMDGLQLLKIVKETYPEVVRIVLSGFTQITQVLATINNADIFNFITKPWNMEQELKYVINKAIEHHQLRMSELQLKDNLEKRNAAYQNVLKKMESNAQMRTRQLQHLKIINNRLLAAGHKGQGQEMLYLGELMQFYMEEMPGETAEFTLQEGAETILGAVQTHLKQCQMTTRIGDAGGLRVKGDPSLMAFAAAWLFKTLAGSGLTDCYGSVAVREQEKHLLLDINMLFADSSALYQHQFKQCSYTLAEDLFRYVMNARFTAFRKDSHQGVQLEFSLEKA